MSLGARSRDSSFGHGRAHPNVEITTLMQERESSKTNYSASEAPGWGSPLLSLRGDLPRSRYVGAALGALRRSRITGVILRDWGWQAPR